MLQGKTLYMFKNYLCSRIIYVQDLYMFKNYMFKNYHLKLEDLLAGHFDVHLLEENRVSVCRRDN